MPPIISLATIAKIASVALLAATATGVGVLTWAAITTKGDEPTYPAPQAETRTSNSPTPPPFSPAQTPPPGSRLSADQAIVYATHFSDADNVSRVEATLMTYAEAREFTKNSTIFPNEPDPDSPTWLLAFTSHFDTSMLGDLRATHNPSSTPPCTTEYTYLLEDPLVPVSSAVRADSCAEHDTITREVAIFNAARYAGSALAYQTPPSISIELMAAPNALPLVDERFPLLQPSYSFAPGDDIWVVAFTGVFKSRAPGLLEISINEYPGYPTPTPMTTPTLAPIRTPPPTLNPSLTPGPTPTLTPTGSACAEIVIMTTGRGELVLGWYFPSGGCTSQEPQAQPPLTQHAATPTHTPIRTSIAPTSAP